LAGGLGATAFKELADDAEGKTAFQAGAARPENQSSVSPRHGASGVEKGRLADAGAAFDDQHSPTPGESPDRRQFGFALKEPGHIRDGRRLDPQLQCPPRVTSVALSDRRLPIDFRYSLFTTAVMRPDILVSIRSPDHGRNLAYCSFFTYYANTDVLEGRDLHGQIDIAAGAANPRETNS
jgi:hypothetical protein